MKLEKLEKLGSMRLGLSTIVRYENDPAPNLNESYCIFGGSSGVGDEIKPNAIFALKSNIYDYIEKAFVMANPQIELEMEFTKSIQREEMSLTFYPVYF